MQLRCPSSPQSVLRYPPAPVAAATRAHSLRQASALALRKKKESQAPVPGAETTRQHYKYDAWNRLVEVRADSTGTPGTPGDIVATYRHDATGRRIRKLLGADPVVRILLQFNLKLLPGLAVLPHG